MRNFNKRDAVKIPLILASGSPRRKQLLEQIGLEFEVCPSQVHENFCLNLSPEAFTEHWAKEKAMDVAKSNPQSLVVAADTIVVLDRKILGKPKNKKDSYRMLKSLSGRTHKVITGMHFSAGKYNIDRTINEQTRVLFNTLSDSDIFYYIDNYETNYSQCRDKYQSMKTKHNINSPFPHDFFRIWSITDGLLG